MRTEQDNRKDNILPSIVTLVTMALIVVLLLVSSLKSLIPPPPPKKMFYVELDAAIGGGGGGGADVPTKTSHAKPSAPNYATQNAVDAPATSHSTNTNPHADPAPTTPTVNQNAMFNKYWSELLRCCATSRE